MKNRIKTYFVDNEEYVKTRIKEITDSIQKTIKENKEQILSGFQDAFDEAFQKGIRMQKTEEKGAIAYLCIGILRSSLLTKTYQLRIDLYDSNFYLDRVECEGYWDVGFAFQGLDDDMNYFTKCARKKLVRIQDAEMLIFMQEYQEHYFDILEGFCIENIAGILELPNWKALKKEAEVNFTYGEFLDKGVILKRIIVQ